MSASSDEIPLSLSLPRPLQASPVCEALQYAGFLLTRLNSSRKTEITFLSGIFIVGCLWSVANMGSNKHFGSPSRTTTADQGPGSVAQRAELYRNFKRHLISKAKTLLHGPDGKRLNHLARVLPIMMQNVKLSATGVTMPENMSP